MSSPYATAEETSAVMRPATANEIWLHEQLDRIDPSRHDMGSAGDTPALMKLVFELRDSATQLQPKQEPYPTIAMGHGVIEVGDATWHGLPALWFSNDGQGLGFQRDRNEEPKPGETIIVFTFANIKGLEAVEFAVERVRRKLEARESESPYGLDCADPSIAPPPPEQSAKPLPPKWISVSDQPPLEGQMVLAWFYGFAFSDTAVWSSGRWALDEEFDRDYDPVKNPITHWMHLPEAPTNGIQGEST